MAAIGPKGLPEDKHAMLVIEFVCLCNWKGLNLRLVSEIEHLHLFE